MKRMIPSVVAAVVAFAATCAQARFVYTETNATEVASGKDGKGTLTDGIWLLGAVRTKNTNNLNVNGAKGDFLGSKPSPLNLTEIYSEDGETRYYAVSYETLSHYRGAAYSTLYDYKDMITEFVAPDCHQTKGTGCFLDCTALTNVQLNAYVTAIGGDRAFKGCLNLVTFYPRTLNLKTVVIGTFAGCAKLTGSFNLPDCTGMRESVFSGCAALEGISAPQVTELEGYAFSGCSSLVSASFSTNVVRLRNYAFKDCASLDNASIRALLHKGLVGLGSAVNNQLGVFTGCTSFSGPLNWNLPAMETNVVGGSMFSGCTSLSRVNFITDVSAINYDAFKNLAPGAELHMPLKAPVWFGNGAISRGTAPFPKVYLKGNFEEWFLAMLANNHLIRKEEFNDTTWSHKYATDTKGWEVITNKMAEDSAMCTKTTIGNVKTVTVHDKKVIAFVMRGNNTGCWVLREPLTGTRIMVQ